MTDIPPSAAAPMNFDPRVTVSRNGVASETLRGLVQAERFVAPRMMRLRASSAALRELPDAQSSLQTEILCGESVAVYDVQQDWALVQLERDSYVGYASSRTLGSPDITPTHKITATRTFAYPSADIKKPPGVALPFGSVVPIVKEEDEFVITTGGAYIWRLHVAEIATSEPDHVNTALRFLSAPYLWGGKTSLGIDCSGLIQLALQAAGHECPRDADMQEKALGEAVPFDENLQGLQRGDLVFWKGHVGLMVNAERMVHANGSHMMVVIEPLREAAQRILAKTGDKVRAVKRLTQ
jgi:cell wall-associated NlpC family hydrolase